MMRSGTHRTHDLLEGLGNGLHELASRFGDSAETIGHNSRNRSKQLASTVKSQAEMAGEHLGQYWGRMRSRPGPSLAVLAGVLAVGVAVGVIMKHRND